MPPRSALSAAVRLCSAARVVACSMALLSVLATALPAAAQDNAAAGTAAVRSSPSLPMDGKGTLAPESPGADGPGAGRPPAASAAPLYPDTPAPAEVLRRDPSAPLPRLTLVSSGQPVVLLRGVSQTATAPLRSSRPADSPISRVTVQVDSAGTRTVVYSDRPARVRDRGLELGCGPGGERAIARLGDLSEEPLLLTSEGWLVGAAQQMLCIAGYTVPQDGQFGTEVEAAVRDLQVQHNATAPVEPLVESGVLDERTRRVLEARVRARLAG